MILTFSKFLRYQRPIQNPFGLFLSKYHEKPIGVKWRKPDIGWTKLNFDGSSKGRKGKASIGGLVRDHKAEFLLGYAGSIENTTSIIAELAALQRGLELVLENGWCNVWLEGDAKTLVEMIMNRSKVRSDKVRSRVQQIKLIIPELHNCIVSHIYREGNRAADKLAKLGHQLEKPHILRHAPDGILQIVREDAEGKIVLRKR